MSRGLECIIAAILLVTLPPAALGKTETIEVSSNRPGQTLPEAIKKSRQIRRHGGDVVRILLHGGTYALNDAIVLTARDSGLVIEAAPHETPIISGATVIGGWSRSSTSSNTWQTEIPEVRNGHWIFHELYVNGKRKARTRVPEQGFFRMVGSNVPNHPTQLQFRPGDIQPEWAQTGDVELVLLSMWTQARNQIGKVSEPANIVSLAGNAFAYVPDSNGRYYIENAPVALRPGQWHLDQRSGVLAYCPEAGEDVPGATIAAPHLYDLVQIKGWENRAPHNIVFRGVTFADADWRLDGGSDLDGQAAEEVHGAVRAEFARDCAFEQCTFQNLGGYALELGRGCERDKIVGNEMHDLGAGGIRVGESQAGPFPCLQNVITDNHIHHIGLVNAPGVGIFVLLSAGNHIAHNEVDHTYYSAISVGWSWGYAANPCQSNIVEYNHLHDIGQGMLSDMGGVYTLGVQPGTTVRNNFIHDINIFSYGGWGLYTDEGSSDIVLENNIVCRCQSAGFQQHYGQNNIFRNNIFAFNREAQLARTRLQPHLSFTFTNNIVYFDTGALLAGNWGGDQQMDHNLYFDERSLAGNNRTLDALRAWQKRGHDVHSLFVDPLFVAPRRDDFQLKATSPALPFGFQPIDMRGVGVRR